LSLVIGLLVAALVLAIALALRWWVRYRRFVWRTDDITASILRDDENLKIGQFLNLDQRLKPNESGWTNMKINIPEQWIVRTVASDKGRITLTLLDGAMFELNKRNVGPLSFDILDDGDDKPDWQLEAIWRKYASSNAA